MDRYVRPNTKERKMNDVQYTIIACLINELENAVDNESPTRIKALSKSLAFIVELPTEAEEGGVK